LLLVKIQKLGCEKCVKKQKELSLMARIDKNKDNVKVFDCTINFVLLSTIVIMEEEKVILVNELDEPIGLMPKLEAHQKAILHRAFSVFVLNDQNEIMLQQRAGHKYHSPLLWTNTCCSHQREGETNIGAGTRRLYEEMGFTTDIKELFHFIYKAPFDNGLTEHELDHVMLGYYNGQPEINPEEVESWKWMKIEDIKNDMILQPEQYTVWFKIIFDQFYHFLEDHTLQA
jgi:isopentenyl-diphosphate delta-isomerase